MSPAPRVFSIVAVGTGVLAAAALPGGPLGIGVALVAGALALSVVVAAPRGADPYAAAVATAGLALASMAVIRDADWLLLVDLLAAAVLASLAATGGTAWIEVAAGLVTAPLRLHKGIGFALSGIPRPLQGGVTRPALRGAAAAVLLVAVFGPLFASADRAFAHLATEVLSPGWDWGLLPLRVVTFVAIAGFAGALVLAGPRYAGPVAGKLQAIFWNALWARPDDGAQRRRHNLEWVIPLAVLDLLFVAFVVVQLTVLFGGHEHVLETAGLTYAEYARQGFFQLLAAAALSLAVVAAACVYAGPVAGPERRYLQVLLGFLCASTLVVLISALRRLGLYEEAFGFTHDRLVAHAFALWLGGIFVLVVVAGALWKSTWLPRAVVVYSAAALLAFNAANPDALIAGRNVARYEATGKIDLVYLSHTLSADAVPALSALPRKLRDCVLQEQARSLRAADPWHSFNLARARARDELQRRPLGTCEVGDYLTPL